jgi:RecB family exonuclease
VSPSSFFAESGDLSQVHREVVHPDQMSTLLSTPPRQFDAEFAAFLQKRIEHFALSPTALNHFLEDPLLFLEVDLLQKPQAKQPHFAYGNAVHHVLAKWADSITDGNPIDEAQMMSTFDDHLHHKELLAKKDLERLMHLGHQTLSRYIASHLQPPYPNVHKVEYPITTHLGDIPIKGKLDRIDLMEPNSRTAIITDYKTGKPKTEKQIVDYGYYRQLVFYDLLIRSGYSIIDPKEFRLEFVGEGAEEPITRSFTISETDRKELTDLICVVWEKIVNLDFTAIE